ncbi:MAG: cellulase family glycosylhydrolase, partial [Calditrichaceae bacterium]
MKTFKFLSIILLFISLLNVNCENKKTTSSYNFTLKTGVNVSHWLSQSTKRGEERIKYITKADFDTIAKVGFDHVRIPIDEVQFWDTLGNKETEAFELLHKAINWAIESNLKVIIDLHIIRSHYFNAKDNTLWTDRSEQEKLVDLWKELSAELNKYPNQKVAYELLNEAVADDPDDWNKVINLILDEVRKLEPYRKIVIGSNKYQIAATMPDLRIPDNDPNLILSFHFYDPMLITHYRAPWTVLAGYDGKINYPGWAVDTSVYENIPDSILQNVKRFNGFYNKEILWKIIKPAIETAKLKKLPLFCGEFGVYPKYIDDEIRFAWYKDICEIFNEHNIAYTHWCYKG